MLLIQKRMQNHPGAMGGWLGILRETVIQIIMCSWLMVKVCAIFIIESMSSRGCILEDKLKYRRLYYSLYIFVHSAVQAVE
jgi:hypothetical protein